MTTNGTIATGTFGTFRVTAERDSYSGAARFTVRSHDHATGITSTTPIGAERIDWPTTWKFLAARGVNPAAPMRDAV